MEKYGVTDASELPSEVGTYYYCPNCASLKAYVTRPKHQKTLNTLSLCSLNISYNAYNYKRFCQKTPLLIGYENEVDYDFEEFKNADDLINKVYSFCLFVLFLHLFVSLSLCFFVSLFLCLEETKKQRDKETKKQRDKETKR
ncbi:MAG: hypothetical protein AAB368_16420 [bacterium]